MESIKFFVARLRPIGQLIPVTNYSFPSGHATMSTIVCLSLFFLYKDRFSKNDFNFYFFRIILLLIPLLIGFSRIYLNVDWFSDVMAGFALGIFVTTSTLLIFRYFKIKV